MAKRFGQGRERGSSGGVSAGVPSSGRRALPGGPPPIDPAITDSDLGGRPALRVPVVEVEQRRPRSRRLLRLLVRAETVAVLGGLMLLAVVGAVILRSPDQPAGRNVDQSAQITSSSTSVSGADDPAGAEGDTATSALGPSTSESSPSTPGAPPTTLPALATDQQRLVGTVSIDGAEGSPAVGTQVLVQADPDGDGVFDIEVGSTATGVDGRFWFDSPHPGCHRLQFRPGAGQSIDDDDEAVVEVCAELGDVSAGLDLMIVATGSVPPDACRNVAPGNPRRGVEVSEDDGGWADHYLFYRVNGEVEFSTEGVEPDRRRAARREWYARSNEYFSGVVIGVSAIRNGVESQMTLCTDGQ